MAESGVSPGRKPRPSLSLERVDEPWLARLVSPGRKPRPSLSPVMPPDRLEPIGPVSPGRKPRPSLSPIAALASMRACVRCRRGESPGLR